MNWPCTSPHRKPGMKWSGLHHPLLPFCHASMNMLATYRGVWWNWDQLSPPPPTVQHQPPKQRVHLLHQRTNLFRAVSSHMTPSPMRQSGFPCAALQVTSYGQRKCQPWCCATWSHSASMKGLRGCTSLENVGTRRVQEKMVLLYSQVPGRLLHQNHLARKPWKKKSWMKAMRRRITSATRRNGRMQMMRARVAAQSPCNQALTNNNNKVVVGSSFWDMPKYMGEGVVLCGPLGESHMSSASKGMKFHDFW